jgi:hypothetical protein
MPGSARRWVARLVQLALVLIAIAFVTRWVGFWKGARHVHSLHVSSFSGMPDSLGPGDMRIYDTDSSVDLVLIGNQLAEGLSPKMVDQVRHDLDSAKASGGNTSGFERLIRNSVAGAIDAHVKYPLADMRDLRFADGKFIVDWKSGGHASLFDNVSVNDQRGGAKFRDEDAQKFIAAVQARLQALDGVPKPPAPPTPKAATGKTSKR